MQDHYVGDIRDFAKYGLLRWLCRPEGPRLGVVWYRTCPRDVDKKFRSGGSLDGYLQDKDLCECDEPLAEKMGALRRKPVGCTPEAEGQDDCLRTRPCLAPEKYGVRTVLDVESERILPDGTSFFSEFWSFADVEGNRRRRAVRDECAKTRIGLMDRALTAVSNSSIVFLDPDNGMYTENCQSVPATDSSLKYVLPREASAFSSGAKRTLVLIQFLSQRQAGRRNKPVLYHEQILRRAENLPADWRENQGLKALVFTYRALTPLVFFVVPGNKHRGLIEKRMDGLVRSNKWGRFFSFAEDCRNA